mmetsp:Transcript_46467/g.92269  ORF Transcript_46467/g.92269 Transcript_46467/m.92269 type:complete len:136 (+) Transcript_46467:1140-1547(+)
MRALRWWPCALCSISCTSVAACQVVFSLLPQMDRLPWRIFRGCHVEPAQGLRPYCECCWWHRSLPGRLRITAPVSSLRSAVAATMPDSATWPTNVSRRWTRCAYGGVHSACKDGSWAYTPKGLNDLRYKGAEWNM